MNNKKIIQQLRLLLSLMELHDENSFKVRALQSALFSLEKASETLSGLSEAELNVAAGKSTATKIQMLLQKGQIPELQELLEKTPTGVIAMMRVKGLGPKKVRSLWQEHGIVSVEQLMEACQTNQLAKLKGFGEKTQESIKQTLLFDQANKGKLHYADAEPLAEEMLAWLKLQSIVSQAETTGQLRRYDEIISELSFLVSSENWPQLHELLNHFAPVEHHFQRSAPFAWRGIWQEFALPVTVYLCDPAQWSKQQFLLTGTEAHLSKVLNSGKTLMQLARLQQEDITESGIYQKAELPYIVPEMREGLNEWTWSETHKVEDLINFADLKGVLHNHCTYSDGTHSLAEMAQHAKALGYEYLGISDHSQTASYANGLTEERVWQQQAEIDKLNAELAPFKIFKGIESDILTDGSLDYAPEILASFDFVVASIHSSMNMDEAKATARLTQAIENPYTTILGHPTGRLLLRREAYPLNHQYIIDACAANGVIIELNANPWRLDLDWRWIDYAMQKGVMISINPDAHEKDAYHDMHYGVLAARKGGLVKSFTFNALDLQGVENHFATKRSKTPTT